MNPSKRLLKAGTALTVLVLLVVGVPWLLAAGIGWPLPNRIPSINDLETVIASPISPALLLNTVGIVGWLAWGWFMWTLVTEAVAALSGRAHRRTEHVGWIRLAVATLIAAMAAVFTATTVHAATPDTAVTAEPNNQPATATVNTSPAPTPDAPTVHTVKPGDSLWTIAETRMHDPNDWYLIYALNKDQPQSDGDTLTKPGLIKPEWTLDIPDSADKPKDTQDNDDQDDTDKPDSTPEETDPPSSKPTPASPTPTKPSPSGHSDEPQQHKPTPSTASATDHAQDDGGINTIALAIGTLVSLGFITALVAVVRAARRRIREYTATTGNQPNLDVSLPGKLAALEGLTHHDLPDNDTPPALGIDVKAQPVPLVGVTGGGLGLTGPGAEAAARAAIAAALAAGDQDAHSGGIDILTTMDTVDRLSDHADLATVDLHRLWVHSTTERLMTVLSREIVARTRAAAEPESTETRTTKDSPSVSAPGPVIAVLNADTIDDTDTLAALLQQGAPLGTSALILGPWPARTIHIETNGHTDSDSPSTCHTMDANTFTDTLSTLTHAAETLEEPITTPTIPDEFFDDDPLTPPTHETHETARNHPHDDPTPSLTPSTPGNVRANTAPLPTTENNGAPEQDTIDDQQAPDTDDHWIDDDTPQPHDRRDFASSTTPEPDRDRATPANTRHETADPKLDNDLNHPRPHPTTAAPIGTRSAPPPTKQPRPVLLPRTNSTLPPSSNAHGAATTRPDTRNTDQAPTPSTVASHDTTSLDPLTTKPSTATIRLTLFGDVEARINGQPVRFTRAKGRELLALLATEPKGLSTETVTEYIVGETHVKKARSHLASIVTSTRGDLRQATGTDKTVKFINYHNDTYTLDPEHFTSDLTEFTNYLADAQTTPDATQRATHLSKAIELYKDDYATDITDDTWPEPIRTTYRAQAYEVALALATHWTNVDDTVKAIEVLERATTIDPYNQDAYAQLIRLQIAANSTDNARKTFDRLRSRMAKMNAKPRPELIALLASHKRPVA